MHFQEYPKRQGLYDPKYEKDSCGVGFICNINGIKSNKIVHQAIEILENLEHRGACGCDPHTGDGAGILIQKPHEFFLEECKKIDINLPSNEDYGTGLIFLPTNIADLNTCQEIFEKIINEEEQIFLGWRNLSCDDSQAGKGALLTKPTIKQIFIGRGQGIQTQEEFERKLYVIRRRVGYTILKSNIDQRIAFYICSLSSKTLVYKGQFMASQLGNFYKDLKSKKLESAFAIVHSRYSTNTFPSWKLAHPYRYIAHNGEINTLRGNVNWMNAREKLYGEKVLGTDFEKIFPLITPGNSDSSVFDNVLELLNLSGRSLPHSVMMMIPEAWSNHKQMDEIKKSFYEYYSCIMEPWDGPASITFTDGRYLGAILDRNGLRPSRYCITKDGFVIMASETGVLNIPQEEIMEKGRLQPGKMFLIDLHEKRIVNDFELKTKIANEMPYKEWVRSNIIDLDSLAEPKIQNKKRATSLEEMQLAFGYTLEEIKLLIHPMFLEGQEATGSMGTDTPLAVLSKNNQLLFNYFKQLFAQVTNPPVDAIREELIMSSIVMLGSEGNLLDKSLINHKRLKLTNPIITNEELSKIIEVNTETLKSHTLNALFSPTDKEKDLEKSLKNLFLEAKSAITEGKTILVISDRGVDSNNAPIPSLLACAGLHHYLIRKGLRTKASLVIETGEAREMHHFAALIGYGANAINPYLIFEIIEDEISKNTFSKEITEEKAKYNFLKSTKKGLYKITSKMGISTIQSYCGAQIFEAVGLSPEFINKYFTDTTSRIGGMNIQDIEKETLLRYANAFSEKKQMAIGGNYHWRRESEYHQYNPETIGLLQHAARSGDYRIFKKFTSVVNEQTKESCNIRNFLKFKKGKSIPIEEVEPAKEIVKRFATGAMSYGSISKEAHETLAIAMNRLGGFSNTGEGGEDPERYNVLENGDSKSSRIKQVAQGRFGVTIEYLVNADQIQIKMAQGAKPGEGGQLPGHKVSNEIARTRHTTPGVSLISPPPHHDIYSIEDLSQLIYDLKNANTKADISVKLVSEVGVGTVAAGVAKGKADHILISGYDGGTGASPQTSIKHAGLPWELGLSEVQQTLVLNDLRGRIKLQVDGQFKTGRDIVIGAMLGADEFGFSSAALVASGCIMLRKCHLNTCSVGIATQDPELRKKFAGQPEHIINFFMFIAEEVREILAELGFRRFEDAIGKVNFLESEKEIKHWKAKKLDFTRILHRVDVPEEVAIKNTSRQSHNLEEVMDYKLLEKCKKAIEDKTPISFESKVRNINRTVGTILSSEIARRYGLEGLPEDTINIKFTGSGGQSFGAFLSKGVTFTIEGDANDYVGKSLSGGKIIIYPDRNAKFQAEENIIVGNVLLYGAISGEVYIRGKAGERFCVRNSGATAVVESVGDHACEYMTGGKVIVLGPTGRNFGAGMSGGIAYVWDKNKDFKSNFNDEMADLYPIEEKEDFDNLKELISKHYFYTNSTVASEVLENFDSIVKEFVKVYPKDYKRITEEKNKAKEVVYG